MKIWVIKRKGGDWWGNYMPDKKITIGEQAIYAQLCFYKRKDAVLFLGTMEYPDSYEIVGKK